MTIVLISVDGHSLPGRSHVWVAYSKEPPWLPVAVADSSRELGELLGVSQSVVKSTWSKYRAGKLRRSRYHRVALGEGKEMKTAQTG